MLWEWIALGLSFLLARQLIVTRREARAVVAVMIGLAVALSAFGLYQYAYEFPNTRADYLSDPDTALREAGLWFEPGSRERALFELRLLESREPIASFALTNSLAGYLAPWLVVAVGIGVGAGLRRRQWRLWLALVVCVLPVAACLILTKSRSAYVACAFGLLLVGWLSRGRTTRIDWKLPATIVAVGAILVAAVMVMGGLDAKVLSEATKSLGYRTQYWRSTLSMIADHPVVGCGPGNFQNAYTRYMLPEASEEIADPHNFVMEVWATAGTPALLALVAVLGCFGYSLVQNRLERASDAPNGPREQPPRDPPPPAGQPDAAVCVLGGALGGYLLGVWYALVSSAAPGVAPVVVSSAPPAMLPLILVLPLAVGAVVVLWRWVDSGHMPPLLPAVGLMVLA
ncbi:MAG: O-antigen ligase family protein, partial [Planctomycetes bacterium]|nr:O-antigen ligase family protein [Planctomycetota bacterium]